MSVRSRAGKERGRQVAAIHLEGDTAEATQGGGRLPSVPSRQSPVKKAGREGCEHKGVGGLRVGVRSHCALGGGAHRDCCL